MAERCFVFFVRGSSSFRSGCLFGWTFVILYGGVICTGMVDLSRPSGRPKSPTKCEDRPAYCLVNQNKFHMPWSYPPESSRFRNYTYSLDRNNSGEKSRLKADLASTIYYRHHSAQKTNTCIQVLNLTWTVKLNESDLPVVGFRLQYNRFMPSKAVNMTDSVLFFLQPGQNMPVDKDGNTMFYFDCLRLSIASKYRFELFSLHESTDNHRHVMAGLERSIGVLNISTSCDVYPEFHVEPSCDYSKYQYLNFTALDRDCSIAAYFIPVPDSFKPTGYDVQLFFNNEKIDETRIPPFACEDLHPLPLKIVGAGSYMLQVRPVGEKCHRYTSIFADFNVSKSDFSDVCQTSTVATLTTGSVLTLPSTDLPTSEEVPVAQGTVMLSESVLNFRNQNVVIAAAAVFVALVVVFAAVVMVFKSRKRRRQMTLCTDDHYSDGRGEPGDAALTRQPVVVIHASDNGFHNKAVHCLAAYLQNHCHCDVSFDQWSQTSISEESALDWILKQLRTGKNVIIIHSEAGFRQYTDTDVTYEKIQHDTPLDDMFVPAMRELRSDYFLRPRSRKLFKVAFPYTDREFFVNDFHSGITYQLMTDLEDLALNIHGLTKRSRSGNMAMVGINERDFTESPEGRELEKAIREAGEYFKQNPNWFSESYRVRPRMVGSNVHSPTDMDCPCYTTPDPLSCCDSGLGTSVEDQNFLECIRRHLPQDEEIVAFTGPDLDDDSSSVSSTNIELKVVMFNQDYDSRLDL